MPVKSSFRYDLILVFFVLFGLYHCAEYMLVSDQNTRGFLLFQATFFSTAGLLGHLCYKNGFSAWGFSFSRISIAAVLKGILLGTTLYVAQFALCRMLDITRVVEIPTLSTFLKQGGPFAFGVLLSSLSEDIFTRGVVIAAFRDRTSKTGLAVLSATIYTLNHIYKIGCGPEQWLYLFFLGILFMIPYFTTGSLWLTGFIHWSGNLSFFLLNNVLKTTDGASTISSNYLFCLVIMAYLPVVWAFTKRTRTQ